MLVDMLGALSAGRAAFEGTSRAIQELAAALHYGSSTLARAIAAGVVNGAGHFVAPVFRRPAALAAKKLGVRRIERVVFIATKADHVPAMRRDNLRHLLRALAEGGAGQPMINGADVSHQVAASILSTKDGITHLQGRPIEIVHGTKLGEDRVNPLLVADMPASMPLEGF